MSSISQNGLQKIFEKILGYFAPKDSPAFTGTPTVPTPADNAGDTQIANVAYVKQYITQALAPTVVINGNASKTGNQSIVLEITEATVTGELYNGNQPTIYNGTLSFLRINSAGGIQTITWSNTAAIAGKKVTVEVKAGLKIMQAVGMIGMVPPQQPGILFEETEWKKFNTDFLSTIDRIPVTITIRLNISSEG